MNSVMRAAVSAAKAADRAQLRDLLPIVFTMRQPPNIVPKRDGDLAATITQLGGIGRIGGVTPAAISSSQMMPMVFCASLLPWPML
jgi:hypothetical protein